MNPLHLACRAAVLLVALPLGLISHVNQQKNPDGSVKGTATYRERIAMLPGAVFEANLEDVSKMDSPADTISTVRIENPGNPPYHFSLDYDASRIAENNSYSVRATIKLEGKLMLTSTQSYPVITRGNPQEVVILLHSVPASEQNPATPPPGSAAHSPARYALERTDWKLTDLSKEPVVVAPDQPEPSITLNPDDHRVSGSGGCNRITGTYRSNGQSLRFSEMASTMMACASGMDQERSYLQALETVRTWKIKGQHLELYGEDGKLIARFEARDKK